MNWSVILSGVVETAIYSLVGVILMGIAFFIVKLVIPFSIRKEIEEDQNISLSIIIGSVILGIAIIVASVINSPSANNTPVKPNASVESSANK